MVDFSEQRKHMVEGHLRPCGVRDPLLLKIASQIPRENFLPSNLCSLAYIDDDIRLDDRHYLLRPNDLMRMILASRIQTTDKVLDIGCTTGYSTVLLSFLAGQVVGVEENHAFVEQAKSAANLEGVTNAVFVSGPYHLGCAEAGPYDVILLQRALPGPIPSELVNQLAEGGRIVYIEQSSETYGRAMLAEKYQRNLSYRTLFELCVPYFDEPQREFQFK
jgi:protein-L-isoaspartate(D-aspartate) O-methyltransferase